MSGIFVVKQATGLLNFTAFNPSTDDYYTPWIPIPNDVQLQIGLAVKTDGAEYSIQHRFGDSPAYDHPYLRDLTVNADGNYSFAISEFRVKIVGTGIVEVFANIPGNFNFVFSVPVRRSPPFLDQFNGSGNLRTHVANSGQSYSQAPGYGSIDDAVIDGEWVGLNPSLIGVSDFGAVVANYFGQAKLTSTAFSMLIGGDDASIAYGHQFKVSYFAADGVELFYIYAYQNAGERVLHYGTSLIGSDQTFNLPDSPELSFDLALGGPTEWPYQPFIGFTFSMVNDEPSTLWKTKSLAIVPG